VVVWRSGVRWGVFGDHNPREFECVLELLAKRLCSD